MWTYFFTNADDLPPGTELPLFGVRYLGWVSVALAVVGILVLLHRRLSAPRRRRMEITIAVVMASGYLLRWGWAAVIGRYSPAEMLPLHLCSIAAIMEMAAVFSRRPLLMEFGYACGIPGAAVAMVLPGVGPYPLWHIQYLLFIVDHLILLLFPLLWIAGDGFRPSLRRLAKCFVLLLAMAELDIAVNHWIGSNFMFLHFVPEGVPLKPVSERLGVPGYQLAMAALLFAVWGALYLPWVRGRKRPPA